MNPPDTAAAQATFAHMPNPDDDMQGAITALRECLELDPEDGEYPSTLGLLLARSGGDLDEALALAGRAVALDSESGLFWEHLGLVHFHRREPKKAIESFKEAGKRDPASARICYNLGTAHLVLKAYPAALEAFEATIARDKTFVDAHHNLAVCRQKLGDAMGAQDALNAALRLDPDDAIAHLQLGRLLLGEERPRDAAYHIEAAHRLDDNNAEVLFSLGQLRAQEGAAEAAVEAFLGSLERDNTQFPVWSNLMALLMDEGEEEALDDTIKACVHALPGAVTHYNLGALFANLDNFKRAHQHMAYAHKLSPEVPAFGEGLRHLEAMMAEQAEG